MVKVIKFPLFFSLIALTSCSRGTPSKNEIQNLIVTDGLPYVEQQVRYIPWRYFYNVVLKRRSQKEINFILSSKGRFNKVKVNDNALKKYIKNSLTVESTQCEENKQFPKFYNCSVSIKYNTKDYYYLKSYYIMFNRLDDGTLSVMNTDDFSLHPIGRGNFYDNIYHDLHENLFSSLKSSEYAPSTDAQSVYIPDDADDVIKDRNFFESILKEIDKL